MYVYLQYIHLWSSIYTCMNTHEKHNRDQQEAIRLTNCNILCSKSADLPFKKHRSTIDALDLLQILVPKKFHKKILNRSIYGNLIGGWTNSFEKYARQIGIISPRIRDENKKYLKPPPSNSMGDSLIPYSQNSFKNKSPPSVASKRKKKSLGNSQRERSIGFPTSSTCEGLRGWLFWYQKMLISKWWWIPLVIKFTMAKNGLK